MRRYLLFFPPIVHPYCIRSWQGCERHITIVYPMSGKRRVWNVIFASTILFSLIIWNVPPDREEHTAEGQEAADKRLQARVRPARNHSYVCAPSFFYFEFYMNQEFLLIHPKRFTVLLLKWFQFTALFGSMEFHFFILKSENSRNIYRLYTSQQLLKSHLEPQHWRRPLRKNKSLY